MYVEWLLRFSGFECLRPAGGHSTTLILITSDSDVNLAHIRNKARVEAEAGLINAGSVVLQFHTL